MKKTIVALALSAVMLTAMPLTVFAHGHSHGRIRPPPAIPSAVWKTVMRPGTISTTALRTPATISVTAMITIRPAPPRAVPGPAAMSTMELSACPTAGMAVTALPAPTIMEAIMAGTIIKSQESQSLIS